MGINRGTVLDLINDVHNAGGFSDYNSYSYLYDQVDTMPESMEKPEPHWHPVSEQPQEEDDYLLLTHEKFKHGTFKRIIIGAWNNATKEWLEEYGDMYRAVNHPVAWISKEELLLLKGYEVTK